MSQGKKLSESEQRRIQRAVAVLPIQTAAKELGHSRNTVKKYSKKKI